MKKLFIAIILLSAVFLQAMEKSSQQPMDTDEPAPMAVEAKKKSKRKHPSRRDDKKRRKRQKLIEELNHVPADPNNSFYVDMYCSYLYRAVREDHADLVEYIFNHHRQMLTRRNTLDTLISMAFYAGSLESCKLLIRMAYAENASLSGLLFNMLDGYHDKLLNWMIENPEYLLAKEKWIYILRSGLACEQTPGKNLKKEINLKMIRTALLQGADVNDSSEIYADGDYRDSGKLFITYYTNSLLGHAIQLYAKYKKINDQNMQSTMKDILVTLIKYGAIIERPIAIRFQWNDGRQTINYTSALHMAMDLELLEIVKLLIDYGADIKQLYDSAIEKLSYKDRFYRLKHIITFIENYLGQGRNVLSNAILNSTPADCMSADIAHIIVEYVGADAGDYTVSSGVRIATALGVAMNYLSRQSH